MAPLKQFTRDEVAKTESKLTRIIIHDKVYDVTEFLNEHPGGEEILLDHKGVDATEDFDDVGHSTDAHELMKKYLVGEIVVAERNNTEPKKGWVAGYTKTPPAPQQGASTLVYMVAGSVFVFLIALFFYKSD